MSLLQYPRAGDVAGAIATHAQAPRGEFLAGGTNLVDLMRLEVTTPELLVDVRRPPDEWVSKGLGPDRTSASLAHRGVSTGNAVSIDETPGWPTSPHG
jgi:hypothetical protein